MSLIVAGRFTTFPAAEDAAQKLFDHGFVEEDVTLFFVNPRGQHARHSMAGQALSAAAPHATLHHGTTIGAVAGAVLGVAIFSAFSASLPVAVIAAGVGAYIGSRIGHMLQARQHAGAHHERVHRESRDSGVLVAVHVSEGNQQLAGSVLSAAGGKDVERATGRWQQGRWADFDPTGTPTPFAELNHQHA